MIGPGLCRDCAHRQFCATKRECRPMAIVPTPAKPRPNTPKPVKRCATCAGTGRVSILPLFADDPAVMPCPDCRPAPKRRPSVGGGRR